MQSKEYLKIFSRTLLIAFAVILLLTLFMAGVLMMFAPSVAADLAYSLKLKGLSVSLAEAQYNRGQDINYIADAVDRAIEFDKSVNIVKDVPLLLDNSDYKNYCEFRDLQIANSQYQDNVLFGYDNYVKKAYISALYKLGERKKALEFAISDINSDNLNWAIGGYIAQFIQDEEVLSVSDSEYAQIESYAKALADANNGEFIRAGSTKDINKALYISADMALFAQKLNRDASYWINNIEAL